MGLILSTLEQVERKVDQIASGSRKSESQTPDTCPSTTEPPHSPRPTFAVPLPKTAGIQKLMAWPEVRRLLQADFSDLKQWNALDLNAEQWLVHISEQFDDGLPIDQPINLTLTDEENMEGIEVGQNGEYLTRNYIEVLCTIYFQSFHAIYPILDTHTFLTITLPRVCNNDFDETDEGSTLVLLVLALGSLAYEGSTGDSVINELGHVALGVRGGTASRPPGLKFLNEARRRMGLVLAKWNLANLQSLILTAYE